MNWTLIGGDETFQLTITPRCDRRQEGGKVGIIPDVTNTIRWIGGDINVAGRTMVIRPKALFDGFQKADYLQFNMDDIGGPVEHLK